jgi:membrane protein
MPVSDRITAELLELTRNITPNQNTYNFVNTFLEDFLHTPRVGLLSFGFLLVIYYASNAMLGVIRTFDKSIYQFEGKKPFFYKRWKAIKMTMVMFALILAVLLLLIGQSILFDKVMNLLKIKGSVVVLIKIIRWVITLGLFFYGISYIYKYGPHLKKRWHTFSPGSILATVLTILTTYVFSFWVDNFSNTNKIYGSIGTVLILMLFIYLNSLILLIGFEVNVSITYAKAETDERQQKELNGLSQKEGLTKLNQQKS